MNDQDRAGDSERPPSWPTERGTDAPVLMSYWPVEKTDGVVAEASEPRSAVVAAAFWEDWYGRAVDAGIDEDLAMLGRDLMRAAWVGGWDADRARESGWLDEGAAMLELAERKPELARTRWRELLDR
ncbi:MAG: hypothetical protein OXT09_32700 [Myxococcales bacterium]|nr:hypothetical protein [Myxococcales bacterium]